MKKYYLKVFFSKAKENEWLNAMGKQGYKLDCINDSKYYFTHSDKDKYSYSIENLGSSPNTEESQEYIKSREDAGVDLATTTGHWAYFVLENGTLKTSTASYKNNASVYFWRTLYFMFFSVMGSIFCGYHAFAAGFLTRVGYDSDGYIGLITIDSNTVGFAKSFKQTVNILVEFLNEHYFSFFVEKFGASDACVVLGAMIPVVAILLVLFALNLSEYIEWHMKEKGRKSLFLNNKKAVKYGK